MNNFNENENITSVIVSGDVLNELIRLPPTEFHRSPSPSASNRSKQKRVSSWNSDLAIIDQDSLTFPDGGVYMGSWNIYHEFAGKGTYTLTNGTIYNGMWNPINQFGIGTITFPSEIMEMSEDGRRVKLYTGSWNNNFEFIQGNLEFIDGTYTKNSKSYNGIWNPDKSGTGVVTVTSNFSCGVYTGSWDNNFVVTGQGTFTLDNGIIYDGEWNPLNLKRSDSVDFSRLSLMGTGTITFTDGAIYTGSWDSNLEIIGEGIWSELKSAV